jgi:hypothetical protein
VAPPRPRAAAASLVLLPTGSFRKQGRRLLRYLALPRQARTTERQPLAESYEQPAAVACLRLPAGLQEAGIRFRAGSCSPDRSGALIQRQRPAARTATGLSPSRGTVRPPPAFPRPGPYWLLCPATTIDESIGDLSSLLLLVSAPAGNH